LTPLTIPALSSTTFFLQSEEKILYLTGLDIRGADFAPGDLASLRAFRHLNHLRFYRGQVSRQLQEELKSHCPKVHLSDDSNGPREL
jgi:hypothetical protein